jgi:GH15 family glucan-1,4-alpha-glucosidase
MDILSAAQHLTRPFLFTADDHSAADPIGAHGLIGDGCTAALVRVDGAIDWLCLPRFDSPSAFGALLDPDRGGITFVRPADRPFESLQRYDPDTNVLETLFHVPGKGRLRLTDYMPWSNDPRAAIHEVHRRLQCAEGTVDLEIVFDPRFGYGRRTPRIEVGEHGVLASGDPDERLVAVIGAGATWRPRPDGGAEARLRMRAGEQRWMVMSWDAPRAEPLAAYRPIDHLRGVRTRWRQWASQLQYDGPWRHHVMRSALCLKLLIYAPTGAMVAAPTTSLPERLGGSRNWDYRYAWPRDAAMAIRAANLIGYSAEAAEYFHFVRDTVDVEDGLGVMYTIDGRAVPDEATLEHLAGYAGSRPVRVGNAARHQLQLDSAGAVVDAAHLFEHFGGTLTLRAWRKLVNVVERVRAGWRRPDHGIWEPRTGMRHNVHSKLMSWLALDRGAPLAAAFGEPALHDAWRAAAAEVHADVCKHGLTPEGDRFGGAYGDPSPDAALFLMVVHGFAADEDPRMVRTVDWVRRELSDGPYIRRYRAADGIDGSEGAFVLCGFWLAEALALQGRLDDAIGVFGTHAGAANHLGLLAEEIDPTSRVLLGNFPQAFSHLGLINAATRLDLGIRLRDEGSTRSPHLIREISRRVR